MVPDPLGHSFGKVRRLVVNQSGDHKGVGLRLWFLRYSCATISLDSRDWRGFSCGNPGMRWPDRRSAASPAETPVVDLSGTQVGTAILRLRSGRALVCPLEREPDRPPQSIWCTLRASLPGPVRKSVVTGGVACHSIEEESGWVVWQEAWCGRCGAILSGITPLPTSATWRPRMRGYS